MIPRDEIVSIAREAGFAQSWSEAAGEALERFAALVAAKVIARTPPPPLVVSMSDVDQAKLAAMLAKRQPMPMVAAPDDSKLAACFDQIKSDLIADGAVEHDLRLEFFPEAVLDAFRRQRAARQEAQQRLADMRELAAKAGLAHRKAEPVAWMWRVADSDWQLESTCPPERPLAIVEPLYTGYMADAYIEAQQRLADLQDLMSKSGLAHRKAVQVAVSEAVAAEREACAVVCESLFVPDQVLGAHPDYLEGKHMAKSQCASNIRARGTP